jgi:hypothetical protein
MELHGAGPVVAARVLADAGDVTRFADRNRFASRTGIVPLDASSREQNPTGLTRREPPNDGDPPAAPLAPAGSRPTNPIHRRGSPS